MISPYIGLFVLLENRSEIQCLQSTYSFEDIFV